MENFIKENSFLFKFLFMNLNEFEPLTRRAKLFHKIRYTGSRFLILSLIFYSIVMMPFIERDSALLLLEDQTFMWQCCMAISMLFAVSKYLTIFLNQEKLKSFAASWPGNYSKETCIKYGLAAKLKNLKTFLKLFKALMITAQVFETIKIIAGFFLFGKSAVFDTKLPFDATRNEIFPFVAIWMYLAHLRACILTIILDSMICIMFGTVVAELEIWRIDFKELKTAGSDDQKEKELTELVDRHNRIFGMVKELEVIFSPYFLFGLVFNSVIICLSAFQILVAVDVDKKIVNIFLCVIVLLLEGVICFNGQLLVNACERTQHEIYNCGWENFENIRLKKSILIILIRSQRPAKLTFMGFSDVNMEQFEAVI
jgi:7tm Odorant receptor